MKAARARLQMTQDDLAAPTGFAQSYISAVERGVRMPPIDSLERIAKALDTTVPWLLGQGIGDGVGNYKPKAMAGPIRDLLSDDDTPSGLRDLASDLPLVANLGITDPEWHALASIKLPAPASKDGYVNLLFTVRAISGG
jgi:transcriptional regulator with XRE-family HTH domain